MLVLSRQKDQSVTVGGLGRIVVIEVRGHRVRLGFDFPEEVLVHRDEVFEEVKGEWRNQMPTLDKYDQDTVIDLLIAEIELASAESRCNEAAKAAKSAVAKCERITLKTNRDEWEISVGDSGPIAIKV